MSLLKQTVSDIGFALKVFMVCIAAFFVLIALLKLLA